VVGDQFVRDRKFDCLSLPGEAHMGVGLSIPILNFLNRKLLAP
jgi:hypothetical protein